MTTDAAVAWLRQQVEGDLERWQAKLTQLRKLAVAVPGYGTVIAGYDVPTDTAEAEDRVADCEAKLAIIDCVTGPFIGGTSVVILDGSLHRWPAVREFSREIRSHVLHLLASAYKHRAGYAAHWVAP